MTTTLRIQPLPHDGLAESLKISWLELHADPGVPTENTLSNECSPKLSPKQEGISFDRRKATCCHGAVPDRSILGDIPR
jgi:hypothetical protein